MQGKFKFFPKKSSRNLKSGYENISKQKSTFSKRRAKSQEPSYSLLFAFVYILNLIVGVGALAMPKAFAMAGWLLGLVLLVVLATLSYMTATYVIEAMAVANAYGNIKKGERERAYTYAAVSPITIQDEKARIPTPQECSIIHRHKDTIEDATDSSESEEDLSHFKSASVVSQAGDIYRIKTRYEMGDMANLFFNPIGRILYYLAIVIYLYGDMAIYVATVPKSLANITCIYPPIPAENITANSSLYIPGNMSNGSMPALNLSNSTLWRSNGTKLSELCYGRISFMGLYRIYIVLFILVLGPLIFFSLSKSKWLQLLTAIFRNIALLMMIIIAFIRIGMGNHSNPPVVNLEFIPNLFGVIIYAFMCQHSIPGMVTPLSNKRRVNLLFFADYLSILCYYAVLAMSAAFTFNADLMEDVYTLNFKNTFPNYPGLSYFIYYFLALFPVFTLSTSFPIIGITLRENLKSLWSQFRQKNHWSIDRLLFPLVAILPPLLIAFFTMDVELLVGITGSYAGVCVQYLIPVALVFFSRRVIIREKGQYVNPHKSPFSHWILLLLIVIWSFICVIVVTIDRLDSYLHFLSREIPSSHINFTNHTFW